MSRRAPDTPELTEEEREAVWRGSLTARALEHDRRDIRERLSIAAAAARLEAHQERERRRFEPE
jgi:hypothetical protein